MPKRFTIRSLTGLTAAVGVSLGALRYPTHLRMSVAFSAMLALLVAATIGGLIARGKDRAACVGFALAGWFHFVLTFTSWFELGTDRLVITAYALNYIAPAFNKEFSWNGNLHESLFSNALLNYSPGSPPADYFMYIVIGLSFFTIAVGAIGGFIGICLHNRRVPGAWG
jgi:hypothetical protein